MKQHEAGSYWGGIVKALGLVFGDIGTSPIYTLTVIFALTKPTVDNVFGILSLVFWTMTILVTAEYAWLAMSLGRKGEGGTIVLKEILARMLKPGRQLAFVVFLSYVGVCLLLGDGVITPAISILSAVEGMTLIPGLEATKQSTLILIAAIIAVGLFVAQYKGTDKVAGAFGPIMVVWFTALTLSGLTSIATMPSIVLAVSPHYAIKFMLHHGLEGFFVLSEVILCATGGEALYADMGHLGRKPIMRAWYFAFTALIINYFGQGVFLLNHSDAKNFLFGMIQHQAPILYIPFLILTVFATIIASQAMISGVFSVIYQGITTRIMPLLRVDYTSTHLKSQIYIGAINWMLMLAVLFIMLIFQKSENLAAAYGLAVTGTMTITGIMMIMIFSRTTKKWKVPLAVGITLVDLIFFISCMNKIPHGGYWSIILAAFPFATILIWTEGQRALYKALRPLDMDTYLIAYEQIYKKGQISGTGLFFVKEWITIPPYLVHCTIRSNIIYQRNVLISIIRTDEPFGLECKLTPGLGTGLDAFEISSGYMEMFDIEQLLKDNGIIEKVIFYGIEDISTGNPIWKVFSTLKKLTPNFVQFNKLPAAKLQGVVTRVEM
ncbi:MAG: KUP/HAK/KT family potassium transporter [Desulfobacteraceae bacterium]|nr:KUP/HAK/KT family potassium transporter [Desulfobacteraceae bacterium]